ncbi:MAG: hypothetical protein H6934_12490 [Burkholderiaceae bacterium]|nr:hypothetical protein [Burkholderiaceae bacterium]
MANARRLISRISLALAVSTALVGAVHPQGSQRFCTDYASSAVSQNRENIAKRCGFGGARWTSDYNGHRNWCLRASSAQANAERNARTQSLRQCGSSTSFCESYARSAVEQARQSQQRRCGFSGARWTTDYRGHLDWCKRVSRSTANGERTARTRDLNACGSSAGRCRDYANTAVRQNQANLNRRCGFKGARWQSSFNVHYNWCRGVSPSAANGETQARNQQLAQCGARSTGRYESRWDKIAGSGGSWTTGWVRNHTEPVCGHGASGCNCGSGRNFCGTYRSGATTYWWPRGCNGPRWTIRCTSRPQR